MRRKFIFPFFLVFSLTFSHYISLAQIVINEFMASNTGAIVDPDNQQTADWIELYNKGNSLVDLSGYHLTDNLKKTTKWEIPAGTQLAANGYLVFWADTTNSGLHTNFALSASGEQIGLSDKSGVLIDSVEYGVQDNALSNYGAGAIDVVDTTLLGIPMPIFPWEENPTRAMIGYYLQAPLPVPQTTLSGIQTSSKVIPAFQFREGFIIVLFR